MRVARVGIVFFIAISCGKESTVQNILPPVESLAISSAAVIEVPNLVGRTVDYAEGVLFVFELVLVVQNIENNDVDPGTIFEQVPPAGAQVTSNSPLVVKVSLPGERSLVGTESISNGSSSTTVSSSSSVVAPSTTVSSSSSVVVPSTTVSIPPVPPPTSPREIVVNPGPSSGQITVSWIPPLDGVVDTYFVKWREYGTPIWEAAETVNTSYAVTGLVNGRQYEFTLKASNVGGSSEMITGSIVAPVEYPLATAPLAPALSICWHDWYDPADSDQRFTPHATATFSWGNILDHGGAPITSFNVEIEYWGYGDTFGKHIETFAVDGSGSVSFAPQTYFGLITAPELTVSVSNAAGLSTSQHLNGWITQQSPFVDECVFG